MKYKVILLKGIFLILLLAFLVIYAIIRLSPSTMAAAVPGDANGDGRVNAIDITKIERIIVGLDEPTPGADANLDGKYNVIDLVKIERIIVGLD